VPGTSQVVFSSFHSLADPKLHGWATLRGQIKSSADFAERAAPQTNPPATRIRPNLATVQAGVWRLLAPNKRELARSASVYSSFRVAHEHVLRLQELTAELVATSVVGPARGTHGFYLTLGGQIVMTNGRWYGAASASTEAAAAAIIALGAAAIATDVRSPMPVRKFPQGALPGTRSAVSW